MAVTNQELFNIFLANPNMSDAQIVSLMEQRGINPEQISATFGIPVGEVVARAAATIPEGSAKLLGDTWVQPEYEIIGSGEDRQVGGIQKVQSYKTSGGINDQLPVGSTIQNYSPTGEFTGTSKTQKTESGFGEFLLGSAALFGGLGGGFEGLFGGGADAAALAADADLAGGLIPEFGSNAAYNGFMTSAMTPEAIAAMDAIVAASPEVVGSGALLTDAAAGVTTPPVSTNAVTNTATTPTTTPTTPPTTTPTGLMNGLTADQLLNLAKAGITLAGTVGATKALTPDRVAATPVGALPTQGVPLNTEDYYKAIQQNYNSLLPSMPRDVSTPLMNWYNSKYGS